MQRPASGAFGPLVVAGDRRLPRVALTFDDGPNPPYTAHILEVLERHHARATFFVVGRAAHAHPELLRRMLRDGDAIGTHGWDHRRLDLILRRTTLTEQFDRTEAAVVSATGRRPALFRPPHGVRNFAVLDEAGRHGEQTVLWSEPLTDDWSASSALTVAARVLARVRNGDILVLHDGGDGVDGANRAATAGAIARIVDTLRARGFTLVTVPELLAPFTPKPASR